ncbi:transcriptional regulator GutM [Martelella alba]|uniref:Transcriptional regulator GutM n=1 Tax=Martelella alba TaxID=2590451 RepID=A0ABY2STQ6_9HYPH|nr:transcriptional regulator GutM [Martelella alba]TKI07739.1 transcriptional regulator GutM [Martelella alba]
MSSTMLLTLCAAAAWLAQIALGGWQIRRFNLAYDRLCRQGAVGVGRSSGRFRARVVLALASDEEGRVCDGFILRGLTVFARPRPLPMLIGLHKNQLQADALFPKDRACQTALLLAIKPKT